MICDWNCTPLARVTRFLFLILLEGGVGKAS
jgi:hypothetical protein